MKYLYGNLYHLVDIGKKRETNEDYAATSLNAWGNVFLAVADGMGGHNKGEYASRVIVESLVKAFQENDKEFTTAKQIKNWLNKVIVKANEAVYKKSKKEPDFEGMGTTLSAAIIAKDILVTAQVGDSRIYILRDNKMEQLSVDQTYVQYLSHNNKIDSSEMSAHKDRHKLTNALGVRLVPNVDLRDYVYSGERLLLCSDGLYNNVAPKILEAIMLGNDSLDKKCHQLIAFGNASGGTDNMAIAIWESKN